MIRSRLSTASQLSYDQNDIDINVYEAPPLTTSEIMDCLKEVGLETKQHELIQPTSGRMCLLYECLLERISYNDDTHQETHQQQDDHGDGTDMDPNTDLMTVLELFNDMKYALLELGYSDFKFIDLTDPDPSRTAKILSVVINYLKSCDSSRQEFENLVAQQESVLMETQRHENEMHEIRQRNREIQQMLANSKPLPKLESELEGLQQTMQLAEQTMQDKADEFAEVNVARDTLKNRLEVLQYKVIDIGTEMKALEKRSQIDYSLLLSKIKAAEKNLAGIEAAVASEKQQLNTLAHTKERQSQYLNWISKAYNMKTEMARDLENMGQLNTIINDLKDNIDDFDTKLNKLAGDKMNIESKIKELDTTRHDLYAQRDKKRETISIHMTKLQSDHQKTLQEVNFRNQQTQEYLDANKQMVLEIENLKNDYTEYVAKRSSELRHMQDKLSTPNDD